MHRDEGLADVPASAMQASADLMVYYAEMVAERRKKRSDDLTSALLEAEIDGDRLTDDEIMAFLFLMVVAGNETTTKRLQRTQLGLETPTSRAGRRPPSSFVDQGTLRLTTQRTLARNGRELTLYDITFRQRAVGCSSGTVTAG
jgi:hypothetical protein